jgi:hypothetical protein
MEISDAWKIIENNTRQTFGKYYSPVSAEDPIGVGQIYRNVRYPVFNTAEGVYDTYEGYVYVLTHECDVSQDNNRPFNQNALICPIIPLDDCLEQFKSNMTDDVIGSFLANIAIEEVSRVKYLPPINEQDLPYGGLLDLNRISNTNISQLIERITSLTNYSLQILDYQLTNHLLRPSSATVLRHL